MVTGAMTATMKRCSQVHSQNTQEVSIAETANKSNPEPNTVSIITQIPCEGQHVAAVGLEVVHYQERVSQAVHKEGSVFSSSCLHAPAS